MKSSGLSLYALFAGCVAVAACSQATELSRFSYTPNVDITHGREARRTDILYGTTGSGGAFCTTNRGRVHCFGTVFSITTGGTEEVLHSFGDGTDGAGPAGGLVDDRGTLYGATAGGGANGYGTVFGITTGGVENVVYSFGDAPDGSDPQAGPVRVGKLYGTALLGGAHTCKLYGNLTVSCGAVFGITTSGTEKMLYSFGANSSDGFAPEASLIDVNGTLYGTTSRGGSHNCSIGPVTVTCGTVFSITTSGAEKVLYSFGANSSDGFGPAASLIDVNGTLYGTTVYGGAHTCDVGHSKLTCGTVFSITTNGVENVVHSFGSTAADGTTPLAGLIDVNGTLYGTTEYGGTHTCGAGNAKATCGTVFSVTTSGTENVLYSFRKGSDGHYPRASLIDVKGRLYGTTYLGGAYSKGTVFRVTTPGTEKVLHSFGNGSDGANPTASLIDVSSAP